jgi:hypothetical protein
VALAESFLVTGAGIEAPDGLNRAAFDFGKQRCTAYTPVDSPVAPPVQAARR